MNDYTSINGKIVSSKNAAISVQDRGFRFGDGLFETCLIKNGSIYNFNAHFARLKAGLAAIKISSSVKDIKAQSYKLIEKNKIKDGILRISISRGVGSLGYLPTKDAKPTIIIETLQKPQKPKSPIKLMVSSHEKPSLKSLPVNYKLTNSLNSVLAKIEAVEKNYFDGILLNEKKQICETSSANIFWIKDNVLYTPDLSCGCLAGTIREKIIQLSSIKVKEVKAKLSDLLKADEVFISNVAIEVLAIDEIQKTKFTNKKYSKIFSDLLDQDTKKSKN